MKTYLLDSFDRYKRFGQTLDVQTILCKPCWWVFNDSGEKECYVFQTDGNLIVSIAGKVTTGTWKFIPQNKSLIISGNEQSYMVHPAFWDENILALQVDGTDNYAFLIDESQKHFFSPKTYTDVLNYFQQKEQKEIKAQEERNRRAIDYTKGKNNKDSSQDVRSSKTPESTTNGNNSRWADVLPILIVTAVILLMVIMCCN